MKRLTWLLLALLVCSPGHVLADVQEASIVIEISDDSDATIALGDVVLEPGEAYAFGFSYDSEAEALTLAEVIEAVDPVRGPIALADGRIRIGSRDVTPVAMDGQDLLSRIRDSGQAHIILSVMGEDGGTLQAEANATPAPYVPTATTIRKAKLYGQPDEDTFLRSLPEDTEVLVMAWGIGPGGAWYRVVVDGEAFYILKADIQ